MVNEKGSIWFRRFIRDCYKLSSHIKFKRIKLGYYRIYWDGGGENAYLGECYKEMTEFGYNIYEHDFRLESRDYFEEYEDQIELTRKIQNYIDGYWEALDSMKTKIYQMKNNKEFYKTATEGYKQVRIR